MDVEPEECDLIEETDDLQGKSGDDTGVDEVAKLGGAEFKLEDPEIPTRIPVPKPYEEEKPLPVSDPPKVKDTILEENLAGELPGFPSQP